MNMIVRGFGQRLFREHISASVWLEALHEHGSASIWSEALS